MVNRNYELVRLANGEFSIRSRDDCETFHPVAGPIAEAEALYVKQLKLAQRIAETPGELVIWDVGLGAGANAVTAIRHVSECSGQLRMISFDRTTEALAFALQHANELRFPVGFELPMGSMLASNEVEFRSGSLDVTWQLCQFRPHNRSFGFCPAARERTPLSGGLRASDGLNAGQQRSGIQKRLARCDVAALSRRFPGIARRYCATRAKNSTATRDLLRCVFTGAESRDVDARRLQKFVSIT
jgi:hypothetical protein